MWWISLLALALLGSAGAEAPESKIFVCSSNESLMALKALYLCQNEEQFGRCGSLAGYLAGRPISETAQKEAKELIRQAADKTLTPPQSNSFSVLNAMVNNQFEADVEDYFPIKLPTPTVLAYAGLRLAAVKSGVWRYPPCLGKGQQYINSEPTKSCNANPLAINDNTYKFLNGTPETHFKGLTDEEVCEHYKQRYEHLVRRTVFVDLSCGNGELTSVARTSGHNLERKIRFDAEGRVTAIEFRQGQDGGRSAMEFQDGKPSYFNNYILSQADLRGRRTARWEAHRLSSGHPYYSELARLKLEVRELISCCREQDATLRVRCQNALGNPMNPRDASAPDSAPGAR